MANTISNLLIGIGFDFDKKSQSEVTSGIDSVKSKALQLGALVGGAFGASALTFGFAHAADEIGKFSEVYGVLGEDVLAIGNAFRLAGGSSAAFMGNLRGFANFRAQLKTGDTGFIESAIRAGLDQADIDRIISAKNPIDALLSISDKFASLSDSGRLNVASALGLDEAGILFLKQGQSQIERIVETQKRFFTLTKEMTKESAEFNDAWQNLMTSVEGVSADASVAILPTMTGFIQDLTDGIFLLKQYPGLLGDLTLSAITTPFKGVSDAVGDLDPTDYTPVGLVVSAYSAATEAATGIARNVMFGSDRSQPIKVTIENKLMLDGKVLSDKITEVTALQDGEAIQNLTSSTDR